MVKNTPTIELYTKQEPVKVYKFEEEKQLFHVVREGQNVFRVEGEEIERMVHATNFQTDEGMFKFLSLIQKLGIEDKLKEKGIQDGDTVKIVDFEFDYYE
jgi:GTP-binding protein